MSPSPASVARNRKGGKMKEKLIVVGGVAGGTAAASRARRVSPSLEIVHLEKGPHISYAA